MASDKAGTPPFEEAVDQFGKFLKLQGVEGDLVWVFREDVFSDRRRLDVRFPVPKDNRDVAERRYEDARRRGLGVKLTVFCRVGSAVACYVWRPRNEEEASYAMLPAGHLKMSVPAPLIDGHQAKHGLRWAIRRLRSAYSSVATLADDVPCRVIDPTTATSHELPWCYLEMGRYMEAMVAAKKLIKAHPEDPEGRFVLAHVYAAQRKDAKAVSELEQLLQVAPGHTKALKLLATLRKRDG